MPPGSEGGGGGELGVETIQIVSIVYQLLIGLDNLPVYKICAYILFDIFQTKTC